MPRGPYHPENPVRQGDLEELLGMLLMVFSEELGYHGADTESVRQAVSTMKRRIPAIIAAMYRK